MVVPKELDLAVCKVLLENQAKMSRYYSTGDVAQMLGCAQRTVVNYVDSGKLKGHRLPPTGKGHGHRRIARADLEKFFRDNGIPLSKLE